MRAQIENMQGVLKDARAVVVGTARNCAPFLGGALANIARFAAQYGSTAFIFVVGDTNDQTVMMLRHWMLAGGRKGRIIDQGNLRDVEPCRTVRLAAARNLCMNEVHQSYSGYDHLIVCDLDEVLEAPISEAGFARAAEWLDGSPSRAGVFANSRPRYFDIWALRHKVWCPGDCWHAIWDRSSRESFEAAKYRHVFKRQVRIPLSIGPVKVDSAFGGLAIYKLGATSKAVYVGLDACGREQAEHVSFHASVRGELFVFPSLVVQAPREHLYNFWEASSLARVKMIRHRLAEIWRPTWPAIVKCHEDRFAS